jgi:hypothetical protein
MAHAVLSDVLIPIPQCRHCSNHRTVLVEERGTAHSAGAQSDRYPAEHTTDCTSLEDRRKPVSTDVHWRKGLKDFGLLLLLHLYGRTSGSIVLFCPTVIDCVRTALNPTETIWSDC